ncbi:MAG: serine hydrolase [Pyrinomonadaceae bacterium]
MKKFISFFIFALVFCFFCLNIDGQKLESSAPTAFEKSDELQTLVNRAADETLAKFAAKNLKKENLSITLIDLRNPQKLTMASFQGEEKIYPASVVKMFYLRAAQAWLEDGKIQDTPEFERGLHDMIVVSSNDATGYIVDVLSGVSDGAELPANEFKNWAEKREQVQRHYDALGYENINVKQKTFCEDAYGREQQFRDGGKNRNKLTTDATARLLTEIVLGKAVNAARSQKMMDLMKRDWEGTSTDPDDQAHGFSGIALNAMNLKGARLWSKAGWTSEDRHDAAYIETPDGLKFVLVTFTTNAANEREIIPNVAQIVLENLKTIKN